MYESNECDLLMHLLKCLQDCLTGVLQQGAQFMLGEGFDVIFSLITEYHKSASIEMKQQGRVDISLIAPF